MQKCIFHTGGFVLHKVELSVSTKTFSAWYDPEGNLIDAEGFDIRGRSTAVRENYPAWLELQEIGMGT